jgi:urease accessory protein UreF
LLALAAAEAEDKAEDADAVTDDTTEDAAAIREWLQSALRRSFLTLEMVVLDKT